MKANYVPVLDTHRRQVGFIHPAQARRWLKEGKAAVFRRFPFTVILKVAAPEDVKVPTCRLKLDPGADTTGIAVLQGDKVLWAAELEHRGFAIRDALTHRRQMRRGRRSRKTRYRKPRFDNRTRPEGWLPPSLRHRIETTLTWVKRLMRVMPIGSISVELVRFDMQKLQNPEISGESYQQGTLLGYEVREYLLEKWGRKCAYCGATDTPLQVEHIHPRSRGGSNRVGNLTLACEPCNAAKGTQDVRDFLSGKPDVLKRVLATATRPLQAAAAVNATRWKLFEVLRSSGLPVEAGTGGRTKFNRVQQGIPKTHWTDAACVGASTPRLRFCTEQPLLIKAKGQGSRYRTLIDKYGFPRAIKTAPREVNGVKAGDLARAVVPNGKYQGTWTGVIAGIRRNRPPALRPFGGKQFDLSAKTIIDVVHKGDGYEYGF